MVVCYNIMTLKPVVDNYIRLDHFFLLHRSHTVTEYFIFCRASCILHCFTAWRPRNLITIYDVFNLLFNVEVSFCREIFKKYHCYCRSYCVKV